MLRDLNWDEYKCGSTRNHFNKHCSQAVRCRIRELEQRVETQRQIIALMDKRERWVNTVEGEEEIEALQAKLK